MRLSPLASQKMTLDRCKPLRQTPSLNFCASVCQSRTKKGRAAFDERTQYFLACPGHPETYEELCNRRITFHRQLELKLILPLKSQFGQHHATSDRGACTGLQTRRESYRPLG